MYDVKQRLESGVEVLESRLDAISELTTDHDSSIRAF
jgi:hypothetical protein